MRTGATKGRLFVVSAPSGAGKTSLVRALLARRPGLALSVSHTTRRRRAAERDGVDYHFVSTGEFARMRDAGEFLEHAEVFGNHYGTARSAVERQRGAGTDIILEIDWQGAQTVRARIPDAISIFILPPSLDALAARLRERGSDSPQVVARRLAQARDDIRHCADFDLCLVNDAFDAALDALDAMVRDPRASDPDPRPCAERVAGMAQP